MACSAVSHPLPSSILHLLNFSAIAFIAPKVIKNVHLIPILPGNASVVLSSTRHVYSSYQLKAAVMIFLQEVIPTIQTGDLPT
jgi:hypothetical protein